MERVERPRIGIDIDGVLADMSESLRYEVNRRFGISYESHQITQFSLEKSIGIERKKVTDIIYDWDFLLTLPTVPYSREALDVLFEDYSPYLVTARPQTVAEPTLKWLNKNKFYRFMSIAFGVDNKGDYAKEHELFWFVEDRYRNALDVAKVCDRVFLMNCQYNLGRKTPENVTRIDSWFDILEYFYGNE